MAASALIRFDTAPPVLEIGAPRRVDPETVEIDLSADEDIFVDAEVEVLGQGVVPHEVTDTGLLVTGLPEGNIILRANVYVEDEVLNGANYMAEFPILVFEMVARMVVRPVLVSIHRVMPMLSAEHVVRSALEGSRMKLRRASAAARHIIWTEEE